jgi:hypothetical protein
MSDFGPWFYPSSRSGRWACAPLPAGGNLPPRALSEWQRQSPGCSLDISVHTVGCTRSCACGTELPPSSLALCLGFFCYVACSFQIFLVCKIFFCCSPCLLWFVVGSTDHNWLLGPRKVPEKSNSMVGRESPGLYKYVYRRFKFFCVAAALLITPLCILGFFVPAACDVGASTAIRILVRYPMLSCYH